MNRTFRAFFAWRAACLLAAAVAAGCGGSSARSSAPPLPRTSGTPVPGATPTPPAGSTNAVLATALAALQTYWSGLPHQSRFADTASVATYMQSLSVFHNVVVGEGDSVWARLPDQGLFVSFLDRGGPYPDAAAAPHAISRAQPRGARRRTASTATSYVMPDPTGVAEFMVDSGLTSPALVRDQIVPTLQARGYPKARYDEFDVINAMALKGTPLSTLYIEAHGGMIAPNPALGYAANFALATTTPVNDTNNVVFSSLLSTALGAEPLLAKTWRPGSSTSYYGLTPAFFSAYVSLGSSALVFVNACHSLAPGLGATRLRDSLTLGATDIHYLGWTKNVDLQDADETAVFVFDRVLGETTTTLFTGPPKQESPIERPFSLEEVLVYGQGRGRDDGHANETETNSYADDNKKIEPLGDAGFAYLVEYNPGSANLLLAPSIARMQVDEAKGILTVFGEFPNSNGSFAIDSAPPAQGGGTTIAASTWTATTATAQIQPSGPTAAGYLVARVMGASGNAAPLTMWKGLQVNAGGDRTGPNYKDTFKVTGSYDFRADIHPYRPAPGAAPTSSPPNQTNSWVMNTSTTHVSGNSNLFIAGLGNSPGQTETITLNTDPPWCELQPNGPECPGKNGFFGGIWDPCLPAGTADLCLEVFGFAVGTDHWTAGPSICAYPDCSVSLEFNAETPTLTVIILPLDAKSNILENAPSGGPCYDPFYGTGPQDMISCSEKSTAVTASFPPLPTTPQ